MVKTCTLAALSESCDFHCLIVKEDRKWWYFIATSGAIFFGGLLVILASRLFIKICNSKQSRLNPTKKDANKQRINRSHVAPEVQKRGIYVKLKEQAGTLITAQTFKGRCLVVISFLLSMLYIVLYAVEASYPVEHCLDMKIQKLWIFDIAFNLFFLLHFLLRFLAANDKLMFWVETLSLVDLLTIPQVFVSVVLQQNWLGLRFLRAMQFIRLADILQFLGIINSSGIITLTVMIGNLFALIFTSAGILHLVTMSTVGFGDISAITYFGRTFMIIFISIGLGMFATYIPAILEYLGSHTVYHGSYKLSEGRNFLPDAEMQSLLKKHFVHVSYFKGTVLSAEDCKRVKMKVADSCIVLCNRECVNPSEEDSENIMRVVAVKNYYPGIRVIIQLLQYQNKSYLLNIPSWNPKRGDDVVCISELKLGFIAQSCLSPGFSTLLANVFSMRSHETSDTTESDSWKTYYIEGANLELYTETLSSSFKGMTFQQVAEICFGKLGLLLIAIETIKPDGEKVFNINPLDKTIEQRTRGYFIADSASEVKRALHYCVNCHADVKQPELIKECDCSKENETDVHLTGVVNHAVDHDTAYLCFAPEGKQRNGKPPGKFDVYKERNHNRRNNKPHGGSRNLLFVEAVWSSKNASVSDHCIEVEEFKAVDPRLSFSLTNKQGGEAKQGTYKVLHKLKALKEQQANDGEKKPCFDISGTFYWCQPTRFENVLLTREDAVNIVFSHHILVCVFNEEDAPLLGLRPLVIPLRASNLLQSELKKIVFLGNKEYMAREWHQLCNFEDVFVLPGSPFCRADLRAVNANLADMVVFLSPSTARKTDDPKLADKESILASLNLKAMSFDDAVGMLSESTRNAFAGPEFHEAPQVERRGSAYGCNVPIITEVAFDQSVQYLDIDDEDDDDLELYLTQPFACGTAFTVSMLDSLMSASYFNPDVLTLVRNLVTGGVNQFLEEHIAEGDELKGGLDAAQTADTRSRCKIVQISLFDGPLAQYGDGGKFGDMFLHALQSSSMICLGLYRFRDSNKINIGIPSAKRYVICSPPYNFVLQQTDLVFVLAHSDPQLEKFK
ncbi:hypothetical protein pdam_00020909 [Pocillopora damicornis]|uniref:BK channel n=1 Tax=Pocillopora damicornis TaxID=46731 RepID=A0A3M6UQ03_POCDA|nr:hypothetical protein pdam_00020909 [Pocillopora damicornis]